MNPTTYHLKFTDPSVLEDIAKQMPSREERKENLHNLSIQCDHANCGKTLPRAALKVCSRCKKARYCSEACQKIHWRAGHKLQCSEGSPRALALKLAERALAVPVILEYLWQHSVLTLGLLDNPSNSNLFAVNVECTTLPADFDARARLIVFGEVNTPNAQVALSIAALVQVPMGEAPERTQRAAAEVKRKLAREMRDAEGRRASVDSPVVAFYFTTTEGDGGKDGSTSVAFVLPKRILLQMASQPKLVIRSSIFDDMEVDMTESNLRDCLNNVIVNDKGNKLRLRGYPNGAKLADTQESRKPAVVVTIP